MELKDRIIQEASTLFFRNGIKSITMSDIAMHLGISKRTLYEVFKDKEELLRACIDCHAVCAVKEREEIVSKAENVIDTMMLIYAKHLNDAHSINKSLWHDLKKYHPQIYQQISQKQGDAMNDLLPLFRKGIEQELIRTDINYEICLWLIKSQFKTLLEGDLAIDDKYSINQFVRAIILNFTRGIATTKGNELIDNTIKRFRESEQNNNI